MPIVSNPLLNILRNSKPSLMLAVLVVTVVVFLLVISIAFLLSRKGGLFQRRKRRYSGKSARYGAKKRKHVFLALFAVALFSLVLALLVPKVLDALLFQGTIDVPYINQKEKYPTGCESVSAVMVLNYMGIDITVDKFIDNYLDTGSLPTKSSSGEMIGCNPWTAFPGTPYSYEGYGCYAPVIASAINKLIDQNKFEVQELYGKSLQEICDEYIDTGIPVIIWVTLDMAPPRISTSWTDDETGDIINWIAPEHCVVLVGYDSSFYYINDPMRSKAYKYKREIVETAYNGMYKQAVVIESK